MCQLVTELDETQRGSGGIGSTTKILSVDDAITKSEKRALEEGGMEEVGETKCQKIGNENVESLQ